MSVIRTAVIGAGSFGANHLRVLSELPEVSLAGVVDSDAARAAAAAATYGCPVLTLSEVAGRADAAIVATPTITHAGIGCALIEAGVDVLVEKPIAADLESASLLVATAKRQGRIL